MKATTHPVLVVEDEQVWREFFSTQLKSMGCQVDTARDFVEARSCLERRAYELILLDVGLDQPGFNILCQTFCEAVKSLSPSLPFIAVSGKNLTPREMATLFKEFRPVDFLTKGAIDLSSFRQCVQSALGKPGAGRERRFDVFLSHNSRDKPAVREVAKALQRRELRVWLDEWELVPGRPWQEGLEGIIQTVNSAAVLVGADGLGPWEMPEMRACLCEFVSRQLPVIPVLLKGASSKPTLPLFLRQFAWVDLRGGTNKAALDRLEWGITGVKPR